MSSTRTRKALLAVIMALVMSLAMASTAFAWGNNRIEVDTSKNQDVHNYYAYQVFRGDLEDGKLVNIEWGDGVEGDVLLSKLHDSGLLRDRFRDAYDASSVAKALEGFASGSDELKAFADIAADCVVGDGEKLYIDDVAKRAYVDVYGGGYWLIRDAPAYGSFSGDTYTNYILEVVGEGQTVSITPKSGTVEHEKEVVEDSNTETYQKFADYEIGQDIPFRLTGTLPENIKDYKSYYMRFTDAMDEGLTFNNDVKVLMGKRDDRNDYIGKENAVDITSDAVVKATKDGFTVELRTDSSYANGFTIKNLDMDTVIYVLYTAKLNSDAVIGNDGNLNTSYLTYSTNPNQDADGETGDTPKETVTVFTWELDVTKLDGDAKYPLADAEFVLGRDDNDGKRLYYAGYDDDGSIKWVESEATAMWLRSPESGMIEIRGLDSEDRYFLKEIKAPAGYNLLKDPIGFQITAVIQGEGGTSSGYNRDAAPHKAVSLELDVNDYGRAQVCYVDAGIVNLEVYNQRGAELPSTGGMGTMIFTGVGILVMAGAIVAIVIRRRKSSDIA